jgi:NDP-sugar pyrophosphorylase family protein
LRTEAKPELQGAFYDFGKHVFPALLDKLPYARLPADNLLWGVQYDGRWFDVGQKRDYLRVNEHLLDGNLDLALPFEKLPWGYLGTDVAIDFAQVTIVPPVVIGSHCTVEPGATLGPYAVIGDGWTIERNACIRHSVLWERYPMFRDDGSRVTDSQRRLIDRHEVREGVKIEECIVAGGMIEEGIRESTVEVLENGRVAVSSIDDQPQGVRA